MFRKQFASYIYVERLMIFFLYFAFSLIYKTSLTLVIFDNIALKKNLTYLYLDISKTYQYTYILISL